MSWNVRCCCLVAPRTSCRKLAFLNPLVDRFALPHRSSQRAEATLEGDETSSGASGSGLVLVSSNTKAKRLDLERRTRWVVSSDEPRDFQTTSLKTLWSPLLRQDAVGVLFPTRAGSMVSTCKEVVARIVVLNMPTLPLRRWRSQS